MLIDLHAHSSGISTCCRIPYEKVVDTAKEAGLDGIVLTNHYYSAYIKDGNCTAFAERYYEEFLKTREYGERVGVIVFFGIELTVNKLDGKHILIYGVGRDFLLKYPDMYDLTLEELYRIVKENNGCLVQAHPFRNGSNVVDTDFLDGVEVNCHPLYRTSEFERVKETAEVKGLMLTCGGDYHADTYRPRCGIYLPNNIKSESDLSAYLCNTASVKLCIHEPESETPFDFEYFR